MNSIFSHKKSRKGALDLSINAIVVLILAITMLGLGLAFIRGLFGGAVQKLTDIYGGLSEEDKKTLMASQEQISFLQSDIKVSGREVNIPFAIRNTRGEKLGLAIKTNFFCFDAIAVSKADVGTKLLPFMPGGTTTYLKGTGSSDWSVDTGAIESDIKQGTFNKDVQAVAKWIVFGTYEDRDMEANSAVVLPLNIKVSADAPASTYSCAFFPTIIKEQRVATDGSGRIDLVQISPSPTNPLVIYSKQYFNIVYTR